MATAIRLVLGILVLLAGRRLFWMFVAGLGFLVAFALMARLMASAGDWLAILVSLVVGALGALLAVYLQRLAIGLAGFLSGGYVLSYLLEVFGVQAALPEWLPFLVGGVLGALLLGSLFDWGLILLSALIGATLIAQVLDVDTLLRSSVYVVLTMSGILYQAQGLRQPAASPVLLEEKKDEE